MSEGLPTIVLTLPVAVIPRRSKPSSEEASRVYIILIMCSSTNGFVSVKLPAVRDSTVNFLMQLLDAWGSHPTVQQPFVVVMIYFVVDTHTNNNVCFCSVCLSPGRPESVEGRHTLLTGFPSAPKDLDHSRAGLPDPESP